MEDDAITLSSQEVIHRSNHVQTTKNHVELTITRAHNRGTVWLTGSAPAVNEYFLLIKLLLFCWYVSFGFQEIFEFCTDSFRFNKELI